MGYLDLKPVASKSVYAAAPVTSTTGLNMAPIEAATGSRSQHHDSSIRETTSTSRPKPWESKHESVTHNNKYDKVKGGSLSNGSDASKTDDSGNNRVLEENSSKGPAKTAVDSEVCIYNKL